VTNIRFPSVLREAHKLVGERVRPGDCVIDATMGNGNDTLVLARSVGMTGHVYGFDIQVQALEQTRERLLREAVDMEQVILNVESHENMEKVVPAYWHGHVSAVMFNLGYLPGGEPGVITLVESTLRALDVAIRLLRSGGIITIVVYPGHPGGDREAMAVDHWAAQLQQDAYQAITYRFVNQSGVHAQPYLVAVYKI
jgi:predicted methyltransferase